MEATKTDEEKAAAEATAAKEAETKATEEKAAEEKAASEQDAAGEKLGTDFDKKVDEGDEHSAYTETDAEKEAKAKADAEASEAEKARAKEEEKSGIDETLLARAEQAGMSREKAGEFSSEEDLERTVVLLEESQSKVKSPDELETEKKAKEEAEAKTKDDEAPYDCKLDPAEYDDGLIKAVNELGTSLKQRVVALEKGHSKHTEALTSDRVTKHTDWLDSKVNRLPDEHKETYGAGDIDDLDESSDEFKARALLDTKITSIAVGLRNAKKPVPSRNKLFDMAIEALHPKGKKEEKVDAKTAAKLEERAKQAVGPGSSRASAESEVAEVLQTQKDFDKKIDDEE